VAVFECDAFEAVEFVREVVVRVECVVGAVAHFSRLFDDAHLFEVVEVVIDGAARNACELRDVANRDVAVAFGDE
jgi:hypothetical protein